MSYKVNVKKKKADQMAARLLIRKVAGQVVLKHALGMAAAAYEIYPVGPPHTGAKAGTPHTRDTFAIVHKEKVIASHGQFNSSAASYEFENVTAGGGKGIKFIAAGASFFLEFGTIYIDPMPILRMLMKKAKASITNELRLLNLKK